MSLDNRVSRYRGALDDQLSVGHVLQGKPIGRREPLPESPSRRRCVNQTGSALAVSPCVNRNTRVPSRSLCVSRVVGALAESGM